MGTLRVHTVLLVSWFPFIFVLQLSWLQFNSIAYDIPGKYYINCGSYSNITENLTGVVFVGDSSGSFSFPKFTRAEKERDNQSSAPTPLYQTARVSDKPFRYKFDTDTSGIHLLRLHFFAFSSSSRNLSSALFNVSVPGFWLLQNFSAKSYIYSPLVEEFFVNVNSSTFRIYFQPFESSFAFVNAIELFLLTNYFIQDESPNVTPKGNSSHPYKGICSRVLRKNLRLDVGGENVNIDKDFLRRNWGADNDFFHSDSPKLVNKTIFSSEPKYKGGDSNSLVGAATEYIAPAIVYQTSREINIESENKLQLFNITWGLHVKKNAAHLVRVHFCDTTSTSIDLVAFNLHIFDSFSTVINAINYSNENQVPFYLDFVVKSDESGLVNISISPDENSALKKAFLNGLEVMEIIDANGPNPKDESNKKNHLPLELGLPLGALVLICIFAVLFSLLLKSRKSNLCSDWWPLPINGGGSSHGKRGSSDGKRGSSHGSSLPDLNLGLKISLVELQFATKNFNPKRIIGKGGFGIVYKGVLKDGTKVAVKRSQPGSGQGLPEFQTEITILSKIRHRHLVSLIGYCDEKSEMILVYEFMEKEH